MQKLQIGDVTVTKIVESELVKGLESLIPRATREAVLPLAWLKPHFITADGDLRYSFHALVIETPARRILVDTCVGNDKPRPTVPFWDKLQLPFLRELEQSSFPRESIHTLGSPHYGRAASAVVRGGGGLHDASHRKSCPAPRSRGWRRRRGSGTRR